MRWTFSFATVMTSLPSFGPICLRLSNTPSTTAMTTIVTWEFVVGDWVWPHLLHHLELSLEPRPKGKLGPRYAGLFQATERVGQVAYRLRLPEDIKLHDIFHVGLKPFRGDPRAAPPPLPSRNTCCVLNSVRARATSRRYLEAPDNVPRPLPQCLARGWAICGGGNISYNRCHVKTTKTPT